MTGLGKAAAFHLKHMPEMNRLGNDVSEGVAIDPLGLQEPRRVREMALDVENAASDQVEDFLERGDGIEKHFNGLGMLLDTKSKTHYLVLN